MLTKDILPTKEGMYSVKKKTGTTIVELYMSRYPGCSDRRCWRVVDINFTVNDDIFLTWAIEVNPL